LGAAIDRSVWIGLARRSDATWRFASDGHGRIVERSVGDLTRAAAGELWLNYPLGVLAAIKEFGLAMPAGFDLLAVADLPVGAGLSSSAAIELASALAFAEAAGLSLPTETLVRIGRHAENHFVGVPCGILDQGVSGYGRKGQLVYIDCRGPSFSTVPMPADAHFWVFNTHTKHALVDGLYAERNRECREAARVLGVSLLADIAPADFAARAGVLPEATARRARHVVEEIARVAATVAALQSNDLPAVGRLLTASHRSSQMLFENSTRELDFLVDTLTALPDVYGARLTGGGFGGAVMALTRDGFGAADAAAVAQTYQKRFGTAPDVLHMQTGNGAERIAV
jgi:galactokinase